MICILKTKRNLLYSKNLIFKKSITYILDNVQDRHFNSYHINSYPSSPLCNKDLKI